MIATIVTTMMLPSRSASTLRTTSSATFPGERAGVCGPPGASFAGALPAGAFPASTAIAAGSSYPFFRLELALLDSRRSAGAFIPALGRVVGLDRVLVEELQASVDV